MFPIGNANRSHDWGYRRVEQIFAAHCREQYRQKHGAPIRGSVPSFSTYLAKVNAQDRFERSRQVTPRAWPERETNDCEHTPGAGAACDPQAKPTPAQPTAPGADAARPPTPPAQGAAGAGWHVDVMG